MADSGSERRESRERSDVKSDTGRRERRESLERSDVKSDTGRRGRRESAERKEREQAQAQLLQAQRLESLGQLAGGVAHDFNNLLAVILSYASFVSEELATPSARCEVVRPQVLDLGHVITGVQELLHRTLGEHIELITTLGDDLWPVLA